MLSAAEAVDAEEERRLRVLLTGPSSTTTNDFWRSRSFHLSVREMELNQSTDWLWLHTVGKGY